MAKFITQNLNVSFAHLMKPDDKFGADTANFNITVTLTDELQAKVKAAVKETGAKKVNGVWENDEGVKQIKFKNRILVKDGQTSFPCVDSQNQPTKQFASGSDVVRLLLSPALIKRDNSLSIYLDGVQIIKKNSTFGSGAAAGFDAVEGGFTDAGGAAPSFDEAPAPQEDEDVVTAEDNDDLPF